MKTRQRGQEFGPPFSATMHFEAASEYLNTHSISLNNDQKLKLYGLYKQATVGDCQSSRPSLFEFVARAKWDAWNALKGMPQEQAKENYVDYVERLDVGWSRQGEYEYDPKETTEDAPRTMGNYVSSMAQESEDTDQDQFGYARRNEKEALCKVVTKDTVNNKDAEGLTALHHAADRGHVDIIKVLLDLGADINATTNDSETALHLACISDQVEVAKLLLERGCDADIRDADGLTAREQADPEFLKKLDSV
ncbi:hypothetical protein VTP01DRAFT_3006 [Rhizomucor pusillus]|uniref:uncharacterized protein n=1 Tax=Rhizomucor pusillus TaxID=4840 RepID=UPI0037433388